jgi:hypothetical protein
MGSSLSCIGNKAHEHATNEQPIFDLDLDKPLSIVKATPERESNWTFPLPEELMAKICDILSQEQALGTLAILQSVSSCSYTLATPFLYRRIVFDTRQALLFFDLFNDVIRRDRPEYLEFKWVNSKAHLLDQKLAVRLRSYMSYTRSLTLITRENVRLHYPTDRHRLLGFVELQHAKTPLWPVLQQCHLNLTDWPFHSHMAKNRPLSAKEVVYSEMSPLLDILFHKLHPQKMSIIIPSRLSVSIDVNPHASGVTWWWGSIAWLHANHIELSGLRLSGDLHRFPRAAKSLTIRFDRPPHPMPGFEHIPVSRWRDRIENRAFDILCHSVRFPLYPIDSLRLIGLIKPDEYYQEYEGDHDAESWAMSRVPDVMAVLMEERLEAGNKKDFRLTIMPDTGPQREAEAVWHTFKVPEKE